MNKFVLFLKMVKIEHSIFALPFAYAGFFIAGNGFAGWRPFLYLTLAMVMVRSFAMAFNRIADLPIDRLNPRTQKRELVSGALGLREAWVFLTLTALGFILACKGINDLCLSLAPIALVWSATYSITKRFTFMCHYVLGSVLALAPVAGALAATPMTPLPAVWCLFGGVMLWVAGFDILYALQDRGFDLSQGLHSIPVRFGMAGALNISTYSHLAASCLFLAAGLSANLGWPFLAVWGVVSAVLIWQHRLVTPTDISRLNMAFFTLNGFISILFFLGVLAGIFLR